jgi:NADH:ubiquinone reductase (H+-translocating)
VSDRPAHRVVVIGSGFGGLFATRHLRRAAVEVTVIDRTTHHLFQPLLYQVATGILSEGEIAPSMRDVVRRQGNARVILGEVDGIDLAQRTVGSRVRGRRLVTPYDSLIVAAGMETTYFGHDEFAGDAPGMKSIDDALELRERIFGAFEMAELEPDAAARRAWLTFAVVGGGPTGVEMAGQIADLAHRTLRGNFRNFDPADARVLLIDGGSRILASFDPRLSARAAAELGRVGVEIMLGSRVTGLDGDSITVEREGAAADRLPAMTKVWGAGVAASPLGRLLAQASGAELDRSGRVGVLGDCTLPGHPEVFVIGDMMSLGDLPGVAEVAMQAGHHAAGQIVRRLGGDSESRPFVYRDLGNLASISRRFAIVELGPIRLSGRLGWLVWLVVHLTFLTGFKNRLGALFHWVISFCGRGRSERTISTRELIDPGRGQPAESPAE